MMQFSINNLKLAAEYFTGNTKAFDEKDDDYKNIFITYATDCNSSSLREAITLYLLGYESNPEKHGHDGIDINSGKLKEVKPRSIKTGQKITNSGNFNDMTLKLLQDKSNYDIVCSLFTEDRLIYIVEFPFSVIYEKIKKPIVKAKVGKRVVCGFGHNDYNCNQLIVHYFDEQTAIEKQCLSKPHFNLLKTKYKGQNDNTLEKLFEC